MRRVSKKRQKRNAEVKEVRAAIVERRGTCAKCGARPGRGFLSSLICHEIARGIHRDNALDKPYAILVLCERCHHDIHNESGWSEARQLAMLQQCYPEDYDLAAYNTLINPNAPNRITQEEVDATKP